MAKLPSKPFVLCKVTNDCNQNCIHCVTDACSGGIKALSLDAVKSIFDDLIQIKEGAVVSLIGGEATIWDGFYDLIKDKKYQEKLDVKVNTNATAIPTERLIDIKESNMFETRISLDSASENIHDHFRGKGTHKKTVDTMNQMKSLDMKYTTGTVVSRENVNHLPDLIEYAKKMGVEFMHFFAYVTDGRGEDNVQYELSDDELKVARDIINKYQKNSLESKPVPCDLGTSYIHIDEEGDCYFRYEDDTPKKLVGNIKKESFLDIFNKEVSSENYDIIDCSKCPLDNDPMICANMHTFCIADLDFR